MINIGDIVTYIDDWKPSRQWVVLDIYGNLCRIAIIRDGKHTHTKNGEEQLNANIVNLNINRIRQLYTIRP